MLAGGVGGDRPTCGLLGNRKLAGDGYIKVPRCERCVNSLAGRLSEFGVVLCVCRPLAE